MDKDFIEKITAMRRRALELTPAERGFVSSLFQRRAHIDELSLSDKQRGWLRGIERKLDSQEFDGSEVVEPDRHGDTAMRARRERSVSIPQTARPSADLNEALWGRS